MGGVVAFTPELGGFVVNVDGSKTRFYYRDFLRAADIPTGLTYTQIKGLKALANMLAVLIRTLIDRQVLDESFMEDDDYSLDAIIAAIEEQGGSYHAPDLSGN